MKVLVTDPGGFVGSTLVEELDTLGFEVYALVSKGSREKTEKFHPIEGDLSDLDSLCEAVRDMDYVFHLAEVTSGWNRSAFFDYNTRGTERIARAVSLVRPQLSRFVYLSSLAAAGPAHSLKKPRTEPWGEPWGEPRSRPCGPWSENDPQSSESLESPESNDQPVSDYGKSKLQGEKELLKYKSRFPISIVRPSLVYGPKDKTGFIFVQMMSRNVMPILKGATKSGHKYYSTIHAKDLCRGMVQAAVVSSKKVRSGEIFYLSGDGIHTYQDLMAVIAERLNCDPLKIRVPHLFLKSVAVGLNTFASITGRTFPLSRDRINEVLSDYWICSNQKAKRVLGFVPEFDLSAGLAHSIEWYKRQRWI